MVITSVYDRCGNHYCFPAGLLNLRSAEVGRGGFTSELEPGEEEVKWSSPVWGKGVRRHPWPQKHRQRWAERTEERADTRSDPNRDVQKDSRVTQ